MTDHTQAHLFRPRSLLGRSELDWARRRLALVDAHHVAITHGTYGIVDGLALTIENDGLSLRVGAGSVYTPYGDLLEVCDDVVLRPPNVAGQYTVSLTADGTVRADRGRSNSGWIRLGSASAVFFGHGLATRWNEVGTEGRRLAGDAARAHVASGSEQFTIAGFDSENFFGFFRRFVPTINGQFERTPIYFASIAVRQGGQQAVVARQTASWVRGWYVEICSPSPSGFTAQLHSDLARLLHDDLSTVPGDIEITLSWLGIDHRRPGPDPTHPELIHADRSCYLPSPPPEPPTGPH